MFHLEGWSSRRFRRWTPEHLSSRRSKTLDMINLNDLQSGASDSGSNSGSGEYMGLQTNLQTLQPDERPQRAFRGLWNNRHISLDRNVSTTCDTSRVYDFTRCKMLMHSKCVHWSCPRTEHTLNATISIKMYHRILVHNMFRIQTKYSYSGMGCRNTGSQAMLCLDIWWIGYQCCCCRWESSENVIANVNPFISNAILCFETLTNIYVGIC